MELHNLFIHNVIICLVKIEKDLRDAVILVFANKMDLPYSKNAADISEAYSLHEIKNNDWHIQACSALTGEGLSDGLDWLTTKLCQKHKVKKRDKDQQHVTKLPDHDKKANLTDLTIEDNMSSRREESKFEEEKVSHHK